MATMMGMTAEQAAEAGKSLTFEKVWAAMDRYSAEADKRQAEAGKRFQELERVLKEVAEQHKETERVLTEQHKETERVLKEVAEQHKETERAMRENDRVLTEQFKETDRRLTERFKETDRRLEKVTQNISKLGNTLGTLVETLVAARLWEKFKMYGLEKAYQRVPIYDENKRTVSEIDILLSNTDCAIAVEVKSNLNERDVDRHIER
ncbi:MAG: hypothetical protein LBK66_09545, partial [Spirochaetaceae bacterium]|nr:hypothetical protein [Spirochaetaceae bacterium]